MLTIIIILSILFAISTTLLCVFILRSKKGNVRITNMPPTTTQNIINNKDNTPLNYQLQAYERVSLYLERIYPPVLSLRLYDSSFTPKQLQALMTESINKEYEHNITQQIYVNPKIWNLLVNLKDNHILIIGILTNSFTNIQGAEFIKKIIEYYDTEDIHDQQKLLLEAISNEVKIVMKNYQQ